MISTYLELKEFRHVEPESKYCDEQDVHSWVASSDANPQRAADGEVSLQADRQGGEHRPNLGHVGHAVQVREAKRINVHQVL